MLELVGNPQEYVYIMTLSHLEQLIRPYEHVRDPEHTIVTLKSEIHTLKCAPYTDRRRAPYANSPRTRAP